MAETDCRDRRCDNAEEYKKQTRKDAKQEKKCRATSNKTPLAITRIRSEAIAPRRNAFGATEMTRVISCHLHSIVRRLASISIINLSGKQLIISPNIILMVIIWDGRKRVDRAAVYGSAHKDAIADGVPAGRAAATLHCVVWSHLHKTVSRGY